MWVYERVRVVYELVSLDFKPRILAWNIYIEFGVEFTSKPTKVMEAQAPRHAGAHPHTTPHHTRAGPPHTHAHAHAATRAPTANPTRSFCSCELSPFRSPESFLIRTVVTVAAGLCRHEAEFVIQMLSPFASSDVHQIVRTFSQASPPHHMQERLLGLCGQTDDQRPSSMHRKRKIEILCFDPTMHRN